MYTLIFYISVYFRNEISKWKIWYWKFWKADNSIFL